MSAFQLALNAWLQKADDNYISGRVLWMGWLVDSASNLLWLSTEQMIKILVLHQQLPKLDSGNATDRLAHTTLDRAARAIASNHSSTSLIAALNGAIPSIDMAAHSPTMAKLEEYYRRRYYVNQDSSTSLSLLHDVDSLYFYLRKHVHPDLGMSTIDEIGIRRKHGWEQTLPYFQYAYADNRSFSPRRHTEITMIGPDGKLVVEDGTAW